MKANELMIGDLVYIYDNQPTKVTAVAHSYRGKFIGTEGLEIVFKEEEGNITPISLTEDILNANGFSEFKCATSRRFRWTTGGIPEYYDVSVVVGMEDGVERWDCLMFEIQYYRGAVKMYHMQYVHELQHVLRSIGLNELANNFKVE